jgi:serine/threonine protein kinase
MANNSRYTQGLFGLVQSEKDSYQGQLGDDSYVFDATGSYASIPGGFPLDCLPLSATIYETPMGDAGCTAAKAPQPYGMLSSWPIGVNPTPYDTYHTEGLDTLDQSMLKSTSVLLDGNSFAESSSYGSLSQHDPHPDMSALMNLDQPQEIMDSQTPHRQKGKSSANHLTNHTPRSKLIEGEVVLRLLFKYISKPTMEDMENTADDTGYSFDFVIDSYCQYRNGGRTDCLTSKGFSAVGRSMLNSMGPGIPRIGVTADSAYGTTMDQSAINNTKPPSKRMRLDEISDPKPTQPVADVAQNKPHQCPRCNQAFKRESDMKRHLRKHAPGEFRCLYNGCGRVFSRKDKLKEHWRRMHEDNGFPVDKSTHRRDDSDNDPDSNGKWVPDDSFARGGSSQNSQTDANPTGSVRSLPSNSFSYQYSLSASTEVKSLSANSLSFANFQQELATAEVIRKLGRGGFASVYEVSICHGIDGNRKVVASKLIRLPKDRRNEVMRRARNEISILQLLDHPHIIKLAGAFALADRIFINILPVADCNLAQFLNKQSLPISKLGKSNLLEQIGCMASALAYIHSYKNDVGYACSHMDLKPENILVKVDAESESCSKWLISDFGLATIKTPTLQISRQNRAATPKYCAPELINGGEIGQAVDIWSLGCVFLEVLTYLHDKTMQDFETFISKRTDFKRKWKYSEITPALNDWLRSLSNNRSHLVVRPLIRDEHYNLIMEMLRLNPQERPAAAEVVSRLRATDNVTKKEPIAAADVTTERDPDHEDNLISRKDRTDFSK